LTVGGKDIIAINYIHAKNYKDITEAFSFYVHNTATTTITIMAVHGYQISLKMPNGCFTFKSIQFPAVTSIRHKMDKWVGSGFK